MATQFSIFLVLLCSQNEFSFMKCANTSVTFFQISCLEIHFEVFSFFSNAEPFDLPTRLRNLEVSKNPWKRMKVVNF